MKTAFAPEGKKVIFFDVNHTLIDPQLSFADSFTEMLDDYMGRWTGKDGAEPKRVLAAYTQEWSRRTAQRTGAATARGRSELQMACLRHSLRGLPVPASDAALRSMLRRIKEKQTQKPRLVPGALETLRHLAGSYRLAIISNGSADKLDMQLDKLHLRTLFPRQHVFASHRSGLRKPNPALFQLAASEMRIAAAQGVMVGNSWKNDVIGAVRAGMDAIWLNADHNKKSSQRKVESRNVFIVRRFDQLGRLFAPPMQVQT